MEIRYNIFRVIATLAILICLSGCSGFLDESDPNKIPESEFYKTEADVVMGGNGAYAALRGSGFYRDMYLYTEVRSDNTKVQDQGANSGVLFQFDNYSLKTDNSYIKTHWADLYKCITRANKVMTAAVDIHFNEDNDRAKVVAEMKFLRALSYSHLVFQFGDVPVVTRPLITKQEIQEHTKRDPKMMTYTLIITDLTDVLGSELPNIQSATGGARASKAAANALLGKVYLMMAADEDFSGERSHNLTEAKKHLEAAWAMKPFNELKELSYGDLFNKDKQNFHTEILFQVIYQSGSSSLSSNFAYNFQPSSKGGLTSVMTGRGNNLAEQELVDVYEVAPQLDQRKAISTGLSGGVYYTRKYIDLDDENGYGGNNWIILRYADVALMLAEVKMHLTEAGAEDYLNMVRQRAGLADYSGSDLKEAILRERRVELAFEAHRWYDLLRFHTKSELVTYMQAKNANFSEKDLLLPIPYDENKLDTEKMYQNEGY